MTLSKSVQTYSCIYSLIARGLHKCNLKIRIHLITCLCRPGVLYPLGRFRYVVVVFGTPRSCRIWWSVGWASIFRICQTTGKCMCFLWLHLRQNNTEKYTFATEQYSNTSIWFYNEIPYDFKNAITGPTMKFIAQSLKITNQSNRLFHYPPKLCVTFTSSSHEKGIY